MHLEKWRAIVIPLANCSKLLDHSQRNLGWLPLYIAQTVGQLWRMVNVTIWFL